MSNTVSTNSTFQQISSLSQLHIVRQLGFMLIMAAGIALGTAIVLWSTDEQYSTLFKDISPQDSADIVNTLEENGIAYQINSATGAISVPSDKVQQIRLQLANDGLPNSSSQGYEILEEEQNIGTSNFIEQARYNRALEQELVETIKHIQGVRDARIHLSIPKQTSFIRNTSKPSASVMMDLISPQSVSDTQLLGVVHLVASSVAGLNSEDVSIIDQRGNLLSQNNNSEFRNSNDNIRYTRNLESDYSNRIVDILTPIVGSGNVRAQVSAELDFTFIETTEEIYTPNTSIVRSEQTQEENQGVTGTATVEPGTLSPVVPDLTQLLNNEEEPVENNTRTRINATRNYEIDRSVSLIRNVPGSVNRLSVAVLVDLHSNDAIAPVTAEGEEGAVDPADPAAVVDTAALDQEKIDRLTQLVRDAIGYNAARGDSVNVINEAFFTLPEPPPIEALPIWQQDWVYSIAKQVGAGLVVIFLIFGVLRPGMKGAVNYQSNLPNRLPHGATGDGDANTAEGDESLALGTVIEKSEYDTNLSIAQDLVKQEPQRAARMIQGWVSNE